MGKRVENICAKGAFKKIVGQFGNPPDREQFFLSVALTGEFTLSRRAFTGSYVSWNIGLTLVVLDYTGQPMQWQW